MIHKLFCYGTLQESSVQLDLINRVVDGPLTSIEGFVVVRDYIDPEDGNAYPRIIPFENGCVYGKVLEFSSREMMILDEYETEMYCLDLVKTRDGEEVFVYMPTYKEGTFKIKGGNK